MMQDRKALQAGTSHFLGQNFAKASEHPVPRRARASSTHAWTTSWGVSTRLVGGMIMTHADDDGMICPPRLAPAARRDPADRAEARGSRSACSTYCKALAEGARGADATPARPCACSIDDRDLRGGDKAWQWIKKGVPIRLEIGPRDIDKDSRVHGPPRQGPEGEGVDAARRVRREGRRRSSRRSRTALFERALAFRKEHTREIDTKDEFYAFFADPPKKKANDPTPIHAGFAMAHFNGDPALEAKIKEDLKVTVRCIPLDAAASPGTCPFTGKPSKQRVVWAKSY